jgi:hypothetical protein
MRAESIRQRIAHEEKPIQVLASAGLSEDAEDALKAHFELIKVLSERLARTRNTPP